MNGYDFRYRHIIPHCIYDSFGEWAWQFMDNQLCSHNVKDVGHEYRCFKNEINLRYRKSMSDYASMVLIDVSIINFEVYPCQF